MFKCDCCGKTILLFNRVSLLNGCVCKDCFHLANYGGYGLDDGSHIELDWVKNEIKKRKEEIANFQPFFTSKCGLSSDDNNLLFMFNGLTHSFMSIHYINAFLCGEKYYFYKRNDKFSNCFHKPVNKTNETCIFVQLEGYTYPSYIKILPKDKQELDECISALKNMCMKANEWEENFRKERLQKEKAYKLEQLEKELHFKQVEYERLKQQLNK